MDPEQIQRTLDLIVGQLGTITKQIREAQIDLAEFRRQAEERLDHIERIGNHAPYTLSRPPSLYVEEGQPKDVPPREPYRHNNPRHHREPVDPTWGDNNAQLLKNIRIDDLSFDGTLDSYKTRKMPF
ncbi:hypothetical protein MA16_Dca025672 [Dendrobium catenatum]|uniref:Uncharacterized protein n=1 Tax=Dendrobium catenatum TaxID=906689 RepID=A0A2I0X7D0_9ASPA|nr:hypothetical protein MA16_Dca025672 [Dendrobium catenatum]